MPPTPTQAMLRVSLGALRWGVAPTTWRGTTMIPAAAAEAAPRNFRRLQVDSAGAGFFFVSSMLRPSLSGRFDDRRDRGHRPRTKGQENGAGGNLTGSGGDQCPHGTGCPMP